MQPIHRRWETWGFVVALLLAAVLRLGWQGVSSFSFDEARVSHIALRMVRAGDFAELGMQSSVGIPNFPALVWFLTLPYALTTKPQLATNFIAAANVLAVVGVWWLARQLGGKWAGLSAAFLYAGSPYLVYYARSIWGQNLLAPLAVLWAVTGYYALSFTPTPAGNPSSVAQKSIFWANVSLGLHAFLAGFTLQVHFGGVALLLASLWLGLFFRLWWRWKPIVLGAMLAFLCALPAIYTIWRFGEGAQAELRRLLAQPTLTDLNSLPRLWAMVTAQSWESFWLNKDWIWPQPLALLLTAAASLITVLILSGGVLVLWQTFTRTRQELIYAFSWLTPTTIIRYPWHLILPWAVCASVFFLRSKTSVMPQYLLVSLPAWLIMAGLSAGLRPRIRWWGPTVTVLCLGIALVQAWAVNLTLRLVAHELVSGGMGTPLVYPQALANALKAEGLPVIVEAFGDIPEFDGDAAAFDVLFWGVPHQLVDARNSLLIPDKPANLLFTFDTLPAWSLAEQLHLTEQRQDFPRRVNEPPYVVLQTDGFVPDGFTLVTDGELANGAELLGWMTRPQGDTQVRLITYWHLSGPLTGGHFQQFNHLYRQGDTIPFAIQDIYTSSRAWQSGDHLITWVDFDLPTDPIAYFHVGMYTWPEQARVPVLHRPGDPLQPVELTVTGE